MPLDRKSLAKTIDNSLLGPDASEDDVRTFCKRSADADVAAVYVLPAHIRLVTELLEGTDVKVGAPIGFPLGGHTAKVKVFETKQAIEDGAQEVDVMMSLGMFKSGRFEYVLDDLKAFVGSAKEQDEAILTKVIIETGLLSDDEKRKAAEIVRNSGADFIKTCTGFAVGRATLHDVALLKEAVGPGVAVKASGGAVSTAADAIALIEAGAARIGTKFGVEIIQSFSLASVG